MDVPSRGSAAWLHPLFAVRNGCVRRLNEAVHHAHTIDPRLGARFGPARLWVEIVGSFVKNIERSGSLAHQIWPPLPSS